mmetsp:Transcript_12389/g.38236  ORF Transcript_12389/g.38236 Transcript_12389/m.38236 type:complete len:233 (-) Transcript_12389:925-1623(-)
MSMAAVAYQVKHDICLKLGTVVGGQLAGCHHRLGVVRVDMKDGRINSLGDVCAVRARAAEFGVGCEGHLVVDHHMDCPASSILWQLAHVQRLKAHALPREGAVTVDLHAQNLVVRIVVVSVVLLCTRFTANYWVDCLKVARVGQQAEMDALARDSGAVKGGSQVVLDVARATPYVLFSCVTLTHELVEDLAQRLAHHVAQHIETAAVCHADYDRLHAVLRGAIQQRLHARHD